MDLRTATEDLPRKEVTLIDLGAISGEGIDLAVDIQTSQKALAIPAGRVAPYDDNVPDPRSPFALHAD